MSNIYEAIKQKALELEPLMREHRQDFHTYAEMGWYEVRTSSIIAARLTELGYQVLTGPDVCLDESRVGLPSGEELEAHYVRALEQGAIQPYAERAKDGFTGVIGILDCGEGPVIAMRFDIDALGVFEEKATTHRPSAEGFRSVNSGMMHACGHDGHAAMGLAVAEILMSLKDRLKGKVKLIFQPAEEGLRGAKPIVDHGHLDDVDFVIGNHVGDRGDREYDIGLSTGGTLASTKLDVTFTGKAAHAGATPEKGDNAMLAAATAVLNLNALPRTSQGVTRVNVGTLQAGSGRNVIPDRATMTVEVRGSTTAANEYMESYARRIIKASAEMHGCGCEIKLAGSASSLRSDMSMIERCQRVCSEKLGLRVAPPTSEGDASEDYSYMVDKVRSHGGQGLFFSTLTPIPGPAHSKVFDIQEQDLPHGVMTFCALACDCMGIE